MVLSDINEVNNTNATTTWYTGFAEGTVKFNIYNMDKLTGSEKTAVAAHECGHCLGLDHNTSNDIMYEYTPLVTQLSDNDKASYDATWANFGRVQPTSRTAEGYENRRTDGTSVTYINGLPVYYSESSYCIDVDNFKDIVGHADYVFVGEVVNQLGEEYKNVVTLEGKNSNIKLQQFGGLDQSGDFYTIPSGTELLAEGETYIFFAYAQENGSLLVRGKNSAVICNSKIKPYEVRYDETQFC